MFATADAADRAFHRVIDRTVGCSGQTTAMHLDDGTTQVWSFGGAAPRPPPTRCGSNRRPVPIGAASPRPGCGRTCCLQAKVCQSGNGGPAVNVLAGAMQNTLGQ